MKTVMHSRSLRMLLALVALGLTLNLGGCSWFKKKAPLQASNPDAGLVPTPPAGGGLDQGGAGLEPPRPQVGETAEFDPASGVQDVHFDYDKADLRRDQLAILDKNIAYFKSNPGVRVMIEGHADERGTTEYNFALGQRRAAAIQDYILQNGIAADRLATVSKGKEQPVDPGHSEASYAKNRRGHFMRIVQ